ncbi:MAG: DUF4258 domain-containing protein [bacterium]
MKPIRWTDHAKSRCQARGATEEEVIKSIREGMQEPGKQNRILCRMNFKFNQQWIGHHYAIKQVAAVISETESEIIVVTVYTFFY